MPTFWPTGTSSSMVVIVERALGLTSNNWSLYPRARPCWRRVSVAIPDPGLVRQLLGRFRINQLVAVGDIARAFHKHDENCPGGHYEGRVEQRKENAGGNHVHPADEGLDGQIATLPLHVAHEYGRQPTQKYDGQEGVRHVAQDLALQPRFGLAPARIAGQFAE